MAIRNIIFGLSLLFLSSCSPPLTPTAEPTQQVLLIGYPPALQPMISQLQDCADRFPELAIFAEELPSSQLHLSDQMDILLWLGEPSQGSTFAFLLDQEDLRVVVNPQNPVETLTDQEIQALFAGRVRSWSQLGGENEQVAVWIYPPNNELRTAFGAALMVGQDFSSFASLAPDPATMIEAVSSDPAAIGLLSSGWHSDSIKLIGLRNPIRLPVLAITAGEPAGATRELLTCLQNQLRS